VSSVTAATQVVSSLIRNPRLFILPRDQELSIIPTITVRDNKEVVNAPAHWPPLTSAHASSPVGIDSAGGAVIVSSIDSIIVWEGHEGHFVKSEDYFKAVLFIGSKENRQSLIATATAKSNGVPLRKMNS
jgi:hypothetical protein